MSFIIIIYMNQDCNYKLQFSRACETDVR